MDRETVRLALPRENGVNAATAGIGDGPLATRVESFEREVLLGELKRRGYRMTETAKALGLERSHLYKKCQQLGIDLREVRKTDAAG